jgi:hypothetical protein
MSHYSAAIKLLRIPTDARVIMLVHCGFAPDKNIVLVVERHVTIFEKGTCNGIMSRM